MIKVATDGTVTFPSFDLPVSVYVSEEARRVYTALVRNPPAVDLFKDIVATRKLLDAQMFAPAVERARQVYKVSIEPRRIGAIAVDEVLPAAGVAAKNSHRVLINLHGGGFAIGAGLGGQLESIPIAALGQIRVLSVDYRQGPEHKYPAATEDVLAVYQALLQDHAPEAIGIYGASAGGLLTSMTVAALASQNRPRPGAIGIFCAGADVRFAGDSRFLAAPVDAAFGIAAPPAAQPNPPLLPMPYLSDVNLVDPLVSPAGSPELLAKFPPTLLLTGTRSIELSAASYTHSRLVNVGVEAALHVWEGMWHAFFCNVDLPESREAYDVIVRFFDRHLH